VKLLDVTNFVCVQAKYSSQIMFYVLNEQTRDGLRAAHKVHIYLEYHSVCPLVGIGPPTPSPAGDRVGEYQF
jgi:hypothetical protein